MQRSGAEALPGEAAARLSAFQGVLLVQAFRPDRLRSALLQLVKQLLGVPSVAPAAPSMAVLHAEAAVATPILFITTPAADPSQARRAGRGVGDCLTLREQGGPGVRSKRGQAVRRACRAGVYAATH